MTEGPYVACWVCTQPIHQGPQAAAHALVCPGPEASEEVTAAFRIELAKRNWVAAHFGKKAAIDAPLVTRLIERRDEAVARYDPTVPHQRALVSHEVLAEDCKRRTPEVWAKVDPATHVEPVTAEPDPQHLIVPAEGPIAPVIDLASYKADKHRRDHTDDYGLYLDPEDD